MDSTQVLFNGGHSTKRTRMTAYIDQLGYLGFGVSDLDAWESFMTKVLGLQLVRRDTDGSMAFRMDNHAYRFLIYPEGGDDLVFVGWEVKDRLAVQSVAAAVRQSGIEVQDASEEELEAREVDTMIRFPDPSGNSLEIFCGPKVVQTPFTSDVVGSKFVADALGLGHIVLSVDNHDRVCQFYNQVLGFQWSDSIICDIGSFHVDIVFLHTNSRHHSLALGGSMDKRMHHFMLQVEDIDDVGLAYDRARDHGVIIEQELGRHPNDRMFSFYAQTPSVFQFEFGWGGREIDDAVWEPTTYHQISEWGHRRPPRKHRSDSRS